VAGREGPPLEVTKFASGEDGLPAGIDAPQAFTAAKINPGLAGVLAKMKPGESRTVIVSADLGYGRAGFYGPEIAGKRRFVISPGVMLVYEVERL
jgi:FKBP-type peptidyl-prolyl cis-trans isomerase